VVGAVAWIVAGGAQIVWAQPEPSPSPVKWELKFEPTPPMRIQVDAGKGLQTYWYILYTVTNETGQDLDFYPEITRVNEIETEATAELAKKQPALAPHITVDPAIVGLHSKVFKAIQERHAKTHSFLKPPVDAISRLLQGRDNSLTSVMVFPDLDPRVSKFTVYVTGLSGEVEAKPNPAYDPKRPSGPEIKPGIPTTQKDDNPKFFVLRKTLALIYTLPGDAKTRKTAQPKLDRMDWVMR
jgi:hypothetical protein